MQIDLESVFSGYSGKREEIIPILQDAQEKLNYLPKEAMRKIAKFVRVPESSVYAIATFYAQFRFKPMGKNHVMVCRGTACHVNGATRVLEEVEEQLGISEGETREDMEYSLETVACIGACSLAPCMMINKDVEAKINKKKVAKIFSQGN
ncbi:MAG: NADH-quinone oxidoreductase subunit NuoE [Chloroflexi bacterium]|nr:NADH-quinone oxidoreductase subunit NuoE [Chloroflexota bacterium]MBT4002575.1 NADH-quinone oxidoreductase subunit NuoE [Chloroflexota bacterium]MBT4305905.1 NADH-quinone oxidoreductase subunit NuoE [Chloroflexota bacterium]MBT4533730.1 NADH-quinone oxidoreductase subunit NuoE [Chloroflexota bacterium]MBT4681627.1 NADH-quinone oxidoreductase subunit NuoE [Chloroflexota bacterium]